MPQRPQRDGWFDSQRPSASDLIRLKKTCCMGLARKYSGRFLRVAVQRFCGREIARGKFEKWHTYRTEPSVWRRIGLHFSVEKVSILRGKHLKHLLGSTVRLWANAFRNTGGSRTNQTAESSRGQTAAHNFAVGLVSWIAIAADNPAGIALLINFGRLRSFDQNTRCVTVLNSKPRSPQKTRASSYGRQMP